MKSSNRKPIDISKAKRPAASTAKRAKRSARANASPEAGPQTPDPAPSPSPFSETLPRYARRPRSFLDNLALGNSIETSCAAAGVTRWAYEKWRERLPGFPLAVQAAREFYRRNVSCAFHYSDIYGRLLMDQIMRDDNQPTHLRLRAAVKLAQRPGRPDWLPEPIPADTNPLPPFDTALHDDFDFQDDFVLDNNEDPGDKPDLQQDPHPASRAEVPHNHQTDVANPTPEAGSRKPETDAAAATANAPQTTHAISPRDLSSGLPASPAQEQAVPVATNQTRTENPDNPDTPYIAQSSVQPTQNQPDTPMPAPAAPPSEKSENPDKHSALNAHATDHHRTPSRSAAIPPNQEREQRDTPPPVQPAAPSEIRTPNVSDGFHSSPERERRVPPEAPIPPAQSQTAEGAPSSTSSNNATRGEQRSDLAHTARDERSNVAPPSPPAKPRETLLTDAFLSATFLHKHEPRQAFERLLKHHMGAYAPATPQEELLTFRITQKSWILRRLDTFERVIADSAVTKVREQHPNAAPAACIAMTFLTRNDTEETSFYNRIAQQRKDHEATLDRLESKLQTLQHRREARADRHQARDDRRQAAAPKRQTSIDATPSPFHQAPTPTLRATG